MWLLPKQLQSPSSASPPESGGSSSGCGSPACEHAWYVPLSGIPTPRPCSWRGWKTRPWIQHLFGAATYRTSMPDHLREWVSSLLATPALGSPRLASDWGSETPDGSGPRSQELSLSVGLHTSSSRTSAVIFDSPSTMFGLTWESWATDVRRDFSRRRRLARRMNASASSSWATPRAAEAKGVGYQYDQADHSKPRLSLTGEAQNWPTPDANVINDGEPLEKREARRLSLKAQHQNGNGAGTPLTIAARSWPTPSTQDAENNGGPSQAGRNSPPLNSLVANWPTPKAREGAHRDSPGSVGHSPDLHFTTEHWPTPRASAQENRTTKNAPSHGNGHGMTLAGEASERSLLVPGTELDGHTCSSECRRLNPQFVNWLQGLPPGWTDCDASATEWFLWWQRTHSERLRFVSEWQRDLDW